MAKHAELGPSSAERWMSCPGSVPLSRGLVDEGSDYADQGTAAHYLAAHCLELGDEVKDYLGDKILLLENMHTGEHYELFEGIHIEQPSKQLNCFEVDADMVEHVGKYVADVRRVASGLPGSELHVEQSLTISYLTGEEDAKGTSDVVIPSEETLVVADLKYGQGVRVNAEDNPQLKMYAASAKRKFELMFDFKDVHVAILQPRLDHISQHTYTLKEIEDFEEEVVAAAGTVAEADALYAHDGLSPAFQDVYLNPSEDACRWCKAKATCPKLAQVIEDEINADFDDLSGVEDEKHYVELKVAEYVDPELLSKKAKSIALIEMWCKAVRGKVESMLLDGKEVPDFKLVEGKMGHRKWVDEHEAEEMMKSMRLKADEMYDKKLISPTTAEKVLKSTPKRWDRIKDLITQTKGAPSVAPASDKRPAMVVTNAGDEMDDLTGADLM
jgi:hypothetical protein